MIYSRKITIPDTQAQDSKIDLWEHAKVILMEQIFKEIPVQELMEWTEERNSELGSNSSLTVSLVVITPEEYRELKKKEHGYDNMMTAMIMKRHLNELPD